MKVDYHIHSSFSDGLDSPEEIVLAAINLGYVAICITDHIRREECEWIDTFIEELRRLRNKFQNEIKIYYALESKVIDSEGDIDILPVWSDRVDFVYAAFHQIPDSKGVMSSEEIKRFPEKAIALWRNAMLKVLENPIVDIIAHPGALLKEYQIHIPHDDMKIIASKAGLCNKIFEINAKHMVPDNDFLKILDSFGVKFSYGSDSHSVSELLNYTKLELRFPVNVMEFYGSDFKL